MNKKRTVFSKDRQPEKRRGKSKLTLIKEKLGEDFAIELSNNDVKGILKWIYEAPIGKLEKLKNSKQLPAFLVQYIKQLLQEQTALKTLERIENLSGIQAESVQNTDILEIKFIDTGIDNRVVKENENTLD